MKPIQLYVPKGDKLTPVGNVEYALNMLHARINDATYIQ